MYHEARDNHVRKDWINPPQLCGSSHHVAGLFCVRRHKSGHSTPGVEMAANTINLKSPHELLAIVPFVLGFRPANSIVVLIGYEYRAGDSLPALEALTAALRSRKIEIHDRLVARNGRWRSLDCHNPICCSPQGSPVPEPADVPVIVSEFVGQGISPHPDREALARQLEPGLQAVTVAKVLRSRQKAMAK